MKVPLVYHLDDLEEISKTIAAEKNKNKKEGEKDILPEEITQTEAIQYVLKKNPNIKGCFSTNVTVNEELLKALGEDSDLKIVSVDGGESQTKGVERWKSKRIDCAKSIRNGLCHSYFSGKSVTRNGKSGIY